MKSIIFLLIFLMNLSSTLFAQDLITKKSGEDIKAKVLEVNQTEIKFKKTDNPDGPIFTMPKSEILMIRYQNGSKDIFSTPNFTPLSATTYTVDKKAHFELGPNVILPTGPLGTMGYIGFGINGTILAEVTKNLYFSGEIGVNDLISHGFSIWNVPLLAGLRYEDKLIAGLGIGASSYIASGETNIGFALCPQLGYSFGKTNLIAKYNSASIQSENFSYFSVGIYFRL